ncbi:glycosyltransferase [Brevundimonas variabilis]|uniref:Glycosyltransferase involved in cell wall biosynthesis n=1 Tax=Brevundimonas variabilis TaxID=74312 RepID=A0A7W9FFM6_9CAUL|nr:glycosyltransferase [Brevundimonas variabilis]MBB5747597.1 glycosyltransferase involved in cell wall biosynthesis [Brevundimonas variabilis]
MRIGIISHLKYPIAEPFAGGLEMHTHMLARRLRQRGHDVMLFASTRSDPDLGLEAICDETALMGVGVDEATDIGFFREHHAYLGLMNRLRRSDFDIIHNNSLNYLPVAMADALPMPMVTTLHTPPFCWLESGIRECRGLTSIFVGVSESIRRAWSAITPVTEVVRNGIDLDRFAYVVEADPDRYLVWCGRIVPEKGLHYAMDAAALVGVPLKIAGPVLDKAYFAKEIAPRMGAGTQYLGHLPHAELAAVIGGASAFLCTPCWEEPYGLVVAEALACGVPVAAFARGAIPEILTPDCGVLATPDDAVALAAATRQALMLDRAACRARAVAACDADGMIDAYEALYARCLGQAAFTALKVVPRSPTSTDSPFSPSRSLFHGQDPELVA